MDSDNGDNAHSRYGIHLRIGFPDDNDIRIGRGANHLHSGHHSRCPQEKGYQDR